MVSHFNYHIARYAYTTTLPTVTRHLFQCSQALTAMGAGCHACRCTGGPGIATFYLSIQSVQHLCAAPPPVAGASDFGQMVTVGEEMRCKHLAILSILLVAIALQLRTLALLSGRWPLLKHGQGAPPTDKHE